MMAAAKTRRAMSRCTAQPSKDAGRCIATTMSAVVKAKTDVMMSLQPYLALADHPLLGQWALDEQQRQILDAMLLGSYWCQERRQGERCLVIAMTSWSDPSLTE